MIEKNMLRIFKKYYPIRNIFFVIIEGMFIYASVLVASIIVFRQGAFAPNISVLLKIFLITFVCQICLYYNDLYDLKTTDSFNEMGIRLLQALGFAVIFLAFVYLVFPRAIIAKGAIIISLGLVILLIVSWRFIYAEVLYRGMFNQKILLLGSGDVVKDIKQEIKNRKDCGYTLTLEVPEGMDEVDFANPGNVPIFCQNNFQGLSEMVQALEIEKVIVSFKEKRDIFPTKELLKCRIEGVDIIDGNNFFENLTGKLTVEELNPSWLIFAGGFQKSGTRRFLKRAIELVLSIFMLILCLPVIIITAILIKLDSKGPVIFSQDRVGEKGKTYRIHKFRSMVIDAEKMSGPVWAKSEDDRVTKVGKFIRTWRIDELPQLWNVLKGDMSFVGPRPEREFFIKKLEELIPYYLKVKRK